MDNNAREVFVFVVIVVGILIFSSTIASCMKRDNELKIEQTKVFLDRGCEQVIVPNTVSSFYWGNCKK